MLLPLFFSYIVGMNTIAARIYDYLKAFPPFNVLTREQLMAISEAVDVIYLEDQHYLFEIGQPVANHFYVVRDGAIGLFRSDDTLVDECDEGDIFGLRALLRKGDYKLNAKAIEESIVYSISSELLETYITTNTKASQFLWQVLLPIPKPKMKRIMILWKRLVVLQNIPICKQQIIPKIQ